MSYYVKAKRASGVVKAFYDQKGFGFIACNDGSGDIFVHISEVHSTSHRHQRLISGETVEFEIIQQDDGRRKAVKVTRSFNTHTTQKANHSNLHPANNDSFDQIVDKYQLQSKAAICDICANLSKKIYQENDFMTDVLTRSQKMNVTKIVILGLDRKQWDISRRSCQKYAKFNMLYYGIGIHPHDAAKDGHNRMDLQHELTTFYNTHGKDKRIVCIGECGLDYNRMFSPKRDQCAVFRQHVRVALRLKLPLVCHEREGFDDFVRIIKEEIVAFTKENSDSNEVKENEEKQEKLSKDSMHCPIPVIIHCFTGTEDELKQYVAMGFYIGITTFLCIEKRAEDLRKCIKAGLLPLDRLLIETDAPFMRPQFNATEGNKNYELVTKFLKPTRTTFKRSRGRPMNEPCLLPTILNTLKICYNNAYTKEQIAQMTMQISTRIFGF